MSSLSYKIVLFENVLCDLIVRSVTFTLSIFTIFENRFAFLCLPFLKLSYCVIVTMLCYCS